MLGELRPERPELPPLEEGGGEELGDEGIEEDDDCWLGQPPMRSAQTAPIAVTCAATTGRRLRER